MPATTAYKTIQGAFPKIGNRELPWSFNFQAAGGGSLTLTKDFGEHIRSGAIDGFQSIFIDNSNNGNALTLQFVSAFTFTIEVLGNTQGIYPVIHSGPVALNATTTATAGGVPVNLVLSNTPKSFFAWAS